MTDALLLTENETESGLGGGYTGNEVVYIGGGGAGRQRDGYEEQEGECVL